MLSYIYEIVAIKNTVVEGKEVAEPIGDALYADDKIIASCLAEEMGRVYKNSDVVRIYEWPLQ